MMNNRNIFAGKKPRSWEESLDALVQFKRSKGHCDVPTQWKEDSTLGAWVARQRRSRCSGIILTQTQIDQLDTIGFNWENKQKPKRKWEDSFNALVEFKKRKGHCDVPLRWKEDLSLGSWVTRQKKQRDSSRLTQEQINRLNKIGFNWKKQAAKDDIKWGVMFKRLLEYEKVHGDTIVPTVYEEDSELGYWVTNQRNNFRRGIIRPDRLKRLEKIGLSFESRKPNWSADRDVAKIEQQWSDTYHELKKYKEKHGHCLVKTFQMVGHKALGRWVRKQRTDNVEGMMLDDRRELLDNLGFVWKMRNEDIKDGLNERHWNDKLERLVEFKRIHGHCCVPIHYMKDLRLAGWVREQRCAHASEPGMDPCLLERLESIGFSWEDADIPLKAVDDSDSEGETAEASNQIQSKSTDGESRRLLNQPENKVFRHESCGFSNLTQGKSSRGKVVRRSRGPSSSKRKKKIRRDQTRQLLATWLDRKTQTDNINNHWEKRFSQLVAYKNAHGDTIFPTNFDDPLFACWVVRQRRLYNRNLIQQRRKEKLDSIGFADDDAGHVLESLDFGCASSDAEEIDLDQKYNDSDAADLDPSCIEGEDAIDELRYPVGTRVRKVCYIIQSAYSYIIFAVSHRFLYKVL
jgi:hypothetical protein